MLTSIPSSSILIPTLKKVLKKQPLPTQTPTPESVSKMESLFLSNIHLFVDDACNEYHVWVNTGIFMKHAGFDISTFIAFSRLDTKRFNENDCVKKWHSFEKYEPDSRPMSFYLKKKGLSSEEEMTLDTLAEILTTSKDLDPFSNSIARDFKRLYGDIVKFSNRNMYVCVDGRWRVDEYNVHITQVINKYSDVVRKDMEIVKKYNDTKFNAKYKRLVNVLEKVQNGLSSRTMDVFRSELFDEHFHTLVDADLDLIGFNNGIFNLKTDEFMPYSQEYIVTQSTKYDFHNTNWELKDDVLKFMRKVFPDKDLYDYMT